MTTTDVMEQLGVQNGPIFIAGPTAVGKSAAAMSLAEHMGGEIISVDSMQVYRGMDIGTAKPSATERARVPHHLIDVAEITEPFSAAKFVRFARQVVEEIQSRGHTPVFCGGTGLYLKAYLDGLGKAPPADAAVRADLEAVPLAGLLGELERRDPETFRKIDRKNPRRIIRALEVIRLTGRPYSELRADWSLGSQCANRNRVFVLTRRTADLNMRIDVRVDAMFDHGLVEETRRLLERGLERNPTAMQAIGYRQVVEHLRGDRPLAETIILVKARTHQFARRQLAWFRKFTGGTWIELAPADGADDIFTRLNRIV